MKEWLNYILIHLKFLDALSLILSRLEVVFCRSATHHRGGACGSSYASSTDTGLLRATRADAAAASNGASPLFVPCPVDVETSFMDEGDRMG